MSLEEAIGHLRRVNQSVPRPLRLPTTEEVTAMEHRLGVTFHVDYRRYLLEASDVIFGVKEPATIARPESHTFLAKVCKDAWNIGVPRELLPICEDNGDYYCIDGNGRVVFWSHNGATTEKWPNLAVWIEQVWIAE